MIFARRKIIAEAAALWLTQHDVAASAWNVVSALDDMGLLMEGDEPELIRCVKCGALLETDVHCDNCGTFHPTRPGA